MEWYKNWFNSEEYLKVYRHRDQKEASQLVQLVINNIDVSKIKTVLDMAAGSGRHALVFAKKGFEVTAVDLSENLLSIGKKYADFQITRFNINAQPYYCLLDNQGELLVDPKAYDLNVDSFVEFLDKGIKEFKSR